MTNHSGAAVEVFYSYAHEDERLRNILEKHLSSLRQEGLITSWHDRKIFAGTDWAHTIDAHLNSASVILLLVSPDFMDSDYCYGIEMRRAMERHEAGDALVIPLIMRPVDWQHAPFAKLQVLPTSGRPVVEWKPRDRAFLDIATGIRTAIQELAVRSSDEDITRLPGKPTSYFESLEDYLKGAARASRPRFPTQTDFAQDLVYVPETYRVRLHTLLRERQRVLLTGPSASGKTVLALAFGKYLQEEENYRVVYKNAARAREGEGSLWHELALAHDRPGRLYILDNCHLAIEEVNEFCLQWEGKPPAYAKCILISRPGSEEGETHIEAMRSYFEVCANETIEVHAQEIYRGVLEKYAAAYKRQDPARYVALEDDSADLLEKQHGQNLIIARSRLDAWRSLGGRLSTVKEEAVYQALKEKYLSSSKVALPMLCVLRQYEIPAHNFFVESSLPEEEVKQLQQERLLTSTIVQNYGVLYDLRLHPAEAREIFKAHIYRQYGQVNPRQLAEGTATVLRSYLSTRPANYLAVYQALHTDAWRQRQRALLAQLLTDRELQGYAAYHFETGGIEDTLRYIHRLAKFDAQRARELLATLKQGIGIEGMCARMIEHPLQSLGVMLDCLYQVHAEMAREIVNELDMQQLASAAGTQSLQSLFRLVRVCNDIVASRGQHFLTQIPLETWTRQATANNLVSMLTNIQTYNPAFQRKQLVNALDMEQIALQCAQANMSLQQISALLRILKASAPQQARMLPEHIPTYSLAQKANRSGISPIEQILGYMHEFGYATTTIEEFVALLDVEQLIKQAETENLQHLYWLLRLIMKIVPAQMQHMLEKLGPAELAFLCRQRQADITTIQQFGKVVPRRFWWNFLHEFSARDIADACKRSPLGTVGSFIQHQYSQVEEGYLLFQEQYLKERLAGEALDEIGKFLSRLRATPRYGETLARSALALLASTELSARVGERDVEQYSMILHNAQTIDENAAVQLLVPLYDPHVLQSALQRSSIRSIQMLIHDIAQSRSETSSAMLQMLRQELQEASLDEKLAQAAVRDLARFVWNVHAHIDPALAQEYCQLVDGQQRAAELESAALDDLLLFLWNLASISTTPELATFRAPVLKRRLIQAWHSDSGAGANLLGIMTMANQGASQIEQAALTLEQQEQVAVYLKKCLAEQRTYMLALTLQGLRAYSQEMAKTAARLYVPVDKIMELIRATQKNARTERSLALIDKTIEWLSEIGIR